MTTDPSIILGGTNIAAEAAKQTAATQQAQAAQGQLQLQQYSIAQAKQDFEDTQNLKQAWRQANGDPTQTLAIAGKLGVSMKGIQAANKNFMEVQNMLDTHNKSIAETGKTNLEAMNLKNENIYTKLLPLMNAKDSIEFESKKPAVMLDLKRSGLPSADELNLLSTADQQGVKDWGTGHLGVKAMTELINAKSAQQTADAHTSQAQTASDKQTNEAASQIQTSNQAKLSGASTQLANALKAGGPVAYAKALDGFSGDELINGSFPKPEDLAKMKPADAYAAINSGGQTSEQRQKSAEAAATLAQQADFQKKELAIRQQSTDIQANILGLDRLKTKAAMFTQGLDANGNPMADADKTLLTPSTQNTSDGRNYIDQDTAYKGLPKGQQIQLRTAAVNAGIPLLSAKEAASVKDVDNARNTINGVFQTFMQHAGTSVLGKPTQAIGNWIGATTGALPDLDAARKNFLSSIETMKSAGGQGSGLRITGAEIMKVGSMMPSLGDTQDQLKEKLKNINELVTGKIDSALHQVPVNKGSQSAPAPTANVVKLSDLQSVAKQNNVSVDEVAAEYKKKGWTVK